MEREAPLFLKALSVALCGPLWLPVALRVSILEAPGSLLKRFGSLLGRLGVVLEASWEHLCGYLWLSVPLCGSVSSFGALRERKTLQNQRFFHFLGAAWDRFWCQLGSILALFSDSWGVLGRLGGILGASWGARGSQESWPRRTERQAVTQSTPKVEQSHLGKAWEGR